MKKIVLLAIGITTFLCGCKNNEENSNQKEKGFVVPENRESFTENLYFKGKEFLSREDKENGIEYVKKHEYNTLLEALEKRYNKAGAEKFYEVQKSKIEEIERMTKSKFYFVEGKEWFFFTPIDTISVGGKIGKIYIPYVSKCEVSGAKKVIFPLGLRDMK